MLTLALANRHGLVTGATGTGKTVTLQVLGRGLVARRRSRSSRPTSRAISPAFPPLGEAKDAFVEPRQEPRLRLRARPISGRVLGFVRRSRAIRSAPPSPRWGRCCCRGMIDLNDVQEGVLNIAFRVADEQGLLLLDLKDLRAMLRLYLRTMPPSSRRNTATSRSRPSAPSSASSWCWKTRAATSSSASRRWR